MTYSEFLSSLPELDVLAQIAAGLDTELRLRGSVARRITAAELSFESSGSTSLFDFVSAFSDIDVVAESAAVTQATRELIRAHLPQSGFFHWDIRAESDLERYRGLSYVALEGQPEIALGAKGKPAAVRCWSTDDGLKVVADKALMEAASRPPSANWNKTRARLPATTDALVDLFYLARNHPELLSSDIARKLRTVARKAKVADGSSATSPGYQRLMFSLLKTTYSERSPSAVPPWFLETCDEAADTTRGSQLRQLLRYQSRPPRKPIAAIIRPQETAGRWVRCLYGLQPLGSEADWAKESQELARRISLIDQQLARSPHTETLREDARLSPIARLIVDAPPDPGCCHYRDFSRGIVEVVWRDSTPSGGRSSSFVIVDLSSPGETNLADDSVGLAHSYSQFRSVSTLRVDYGFLSVLAGRRRSIGILGAA